MVLGYVLFYSLFHVTLLICCRWCAVPEEDWPEAGTGRDVILNDWELDGLYGDRRQEIVFIGVGMDQQKIEEQVSSKEL